MQSFKLGVFNMDLTIELKIQIQGLELLKLEMNFEMYLQNCRRYLNMLTHSKVESSKEQILSSILFYLELPKELFKTMCVFKAIFIRLKIKYTVFRFFSIFCSNFTEL